MVQPLELGLAGGLGFTVCALGFLGPLEGFEVTQHPLLGVSRKSEVSVRTVTDWEKLTICLGELR